MELPPVQFPVHVGIGEKNLRCAALDDYVEDVEEKHELAPTCPFCEPVREVMPQSVREDPKSPKSRINFIKVFDLVVKVPFDCGVELHLTGALQENFQKERQKVEVLLCRWKREWIDLEIARLKAHAHVRTIK